jgi:hypothetical protein
MTAAETTSETRSGIVTVGDRVVVLPFPVVSSVDVPGGVVFVVAPPVGIASPISMIVVDDDGTIRWVAEPCAWPPAHDPYVHVELVDDRLLAESAQGWHIAIDLRTGAGTMQEAVA